MPRFTKDPGAMSFATSRARSSRPSGVAEVWRDFSLDCTLMSGRLSCCAAAAGNLDDAVDVDARGDHVLRVQPAGGHDPGDLDDGVLRGRCHDGAKVPGGLAIHQVALAVSLQGLDEGDVGVDGGFEHVAAAVDDPGFLALGEHGAVAGGGEEPADAGPCRADPFGEVALRDEFELDLLGLVLGVEVPGVGLPREGADHLLHPALLDQQGQALVALARVVVHHGQVRGAAVQQRVDQFERLAGVAEPADHHGGAVLDAGDGVLDRIYEVQHYWSFPAVTFSRTTARPWPTPMQMAATPQRSPEACRDRAKVPRIRVPEAPSGCPMAIAPPCRFTIEWSIPQALMHARDCAAKASLSSTAPTCSQPMPAFSRALFAASTGA